MIRLLGRLLTEARDAPVRVSYLSKAEEPAWRNGHLVSIDPQGACFEWVDGDIDVVECLPWGMIGAIRLATSTQP